MGQPKQALPFRGSTIVGKVVRTLLSTGLDGVAVVTRRELIPNLDLPTDSRLRVSLNDDAESQMIDSIRIGLTTWFNSNVRPTNAEEGESMSIEGASDRAGALIVPGDMPKLSLAACQVCIKAFREAPTNIIVAACAGRRGHPIIFPASLSAEVLDLQGGLNLLAQRHPNRVQLVETGDPGTLEDVDTWEQYRF
jgi:CTP:molybdopterin cytidylyltransferase MocA